MSFALLGRADCGGLASLTLEAARHLRPQRVLLLDLGAAGRGLADAHAYDDYANEVCVEPFDGGIPAPAIEWLTRPDVDCIFSAETLYDDRILHAAQANGIRTVVLAMPELAPWSTDVARTHGPRPELFVPTAWRADTLPGARLLPVPVARDRLPFRQRTKVEHLYHVTGAAMLDRNGTELLLAALPHVTRDVRLTIRSERPLQLPAAPHVHVDVVTEPAAHYWETVPADADLLVMPRRYGGLSLPVQECASLGIPSLLLSTDAYSSAPFTRLLPVTRSVEHRMKGGTVKVWDADQRDLAHMIDTLTTNAHFARLDSDRANEWAHAHAWDSSLRDQWCLALNADCTAAAA